MISLVTWRDAKEDPPTDYRRLWADGWVVFYSQRTHLWYHYSDPQKLEGPPLHPQPSLYCDPQPPTPGGPTVGDVRWVHNAALAHAINDLGDAAQKEDALGILARLRAALPKEDK